MQTSKFLERWFFGFGLLIAAVLTLSCRAQPAQVAPANEAARYEFRQDHDPDGIGKFFLGREIAHVMGHQAADWLERPEREEEERTDLLIEALKLREGEVVADIGCGSGYVSRK